MSDERDQNDQGDQKKKSPESSESSGLDDGAVQSQEEKDKAEAAAKAKAEAAAKAAAAKAAKEAAEAAKPVWERMPETPATSDASDDALVAALRAAHPDIIQSATETAGDLTLGVAKDSIREVCQALKDQHGYHLLVDVCGVDFSSRESARFDVVYHVYSIEKNRRVRLKVEVEEDGEVPSVGSVWKGAEWCEREAYDMYGIRFADHPDLTRILLWEGFNGYPLRKDFPVEGIDTGAAIYPEYYESEAGPVAGTGTGWKPPEPPQPLETESEPQADPEPAGEAG